jgi:putative intracellular protease/amidase
MRVLIILNADSDSKTGGVPEFDGLIEAYYLFRDAGLDVVVAASGGGSASETPATTSGGHRPATAEAIRRFASDRVARDLMNDLVDLAAVCSGDFNGAICLGPQNFGEAGVNDCADGLVAQLLTAGKPVAVITSAGVGVLPRAANGVLIVGNSVEAPRLAANGLLGAMRVH